MQQWLWQNSFEGLKDIISAYSSLTILYDPFLVKTHYQPVNTVFEWVQDIIARAYRQSAPQLETAVIKHRIPVSYGGVDGMDLVALARQKQLTPDEVVRIHTAQVYRVHMIGFLPGFPYMAEVDKRITVNRKEKPVPVPAGSVGITGSQTGIYPFNSPGGWYIIGRTPVQLFNAQAENPVLLRAGDEVEFYDVNSQ